MSILIRGMEMPYGCANCSFMSGAVYDLKGRAHYFCNADVEGIRGTDVTNEVIAMYEGDEFSFPNFCPLVEVKEPHGRLIDADELKTAFPICDNSMDIKIASVRATINHAPTVIEAEGSET